MKPEAPVRRIRIVSTVQRGPAESTVLAEVLHSGEDQRARTSSLDALAVSPSRRSRLS
jgi:hypothetical protein